MVVKNLQPQNSSGSPMKFERELVTFLAEYLPKAALFPSTRSARWSVKLYTISTPLDQTPVDSILSLMKVRRGKRRRPASALD